MGYQRHRIQKKSPHSRAFKPSEDPLATRPFAKGVQARSAELPATDLLRSRPFAPKVQTQQEMPDLQTRLERAERVGYNAGNIPLFAPSTPPPMQREELGGEEVEEQGEVGIQEQQLQAPPNDGTIQQVHEQVIQRVSREEGKEIAKKLDIDDQDFGQWVFEKTVGEELTEEDFLETISEDNLDQNLRSWQKNRKKEQEFLEQNQTKEAIAQLTKKLRDETVALLISSPITKPYIDKTKTEAINLIILRNAKFIQTKLDLATINLKDALAKEKRINILGEIDRNRGFTVKNDKNEKTSYVRLGTALEESVHVILHEFIHQFCHTNFEKYNELIRETATETIARAVLTEKNLQESGKDYEEYIKFMAAFLNISQTQLGAFFAEDYFLGNGKFAKHVQSKWGQEAVNVLSEDLPVTEVTTKLVNIQEQKIKQKKKGCTIL